MNPVDLLPVPLGGNRIPESMRGDIVMHSNSASDNTNMRIDNSIVTGINTGINTSMDSSNNSSKNTSNSDESTKCSSWRDLPECLDASPKNYGKTFEAIMDLRQNINTFKKQLSAISLPMKQYLFCTDPGEGTYESSIEAGLKGLHEMCTKIREGVDSGREITQEDTCVDKALREEVLNVLNRVELDVVEQTSNIRMLCHTTLQKYKLIHTNPTSIHTPTNTQTHNNTLHSNSSKELYGDFNLQLGPITRKIFATQNTLLTLIKLIKKHHSNTNTLQ